MKNNVLEYLESAARQFSQRTAYADEVHDFTFEQVRSMAMAVGTGIHSLKKPRQPVAVMMEKGAFMAAVLLGVVYGGCCYCPIDVAMPRERMETILSVLEPAAIVAEKKWEQLAGELAGGCPVLLAEELVEMPAREAELLAALSASRNTDPLYILFTSGSTGVPKGVVGTHRTIINNLEWLDARYRLSPEDVLGNQVPLHFVVANHDLYCPLRFGCSSYFIPPSYFSFPDQMVALLNEKRVTTVFWVPFALGITADLRVLENAVPRYLRRVFFVGEVMPVKKLNYWRIHVPEAVYVNLYGSTETHMCCYYEVDRDFSESETLPIGSPCSRIETLVLSKKNQRIGPESREIGELCIGGPAVGPGYYNSPEKTVRRYLKNPLSETEDEVIYRTGDLVRYSREGLLEYCGRMDYQIKHLGYRIELGEIEAAAGKIPGIQSCACIYDKKKQLILFLYDGAKQERKVISGGLSERLPRYMMPNRYFYLENLPRNGNGKIDRKALEEEYTDTKK